MTDPAPADETRAAAEPPAGTPGAQTHTNGGQILADAQRAQAEASREPPPADLPHEGAIRARERGSRLRRLLAINDLLALMAALAVATTAFRDVDVGTLFWAVLLSPSWILVTKLQGLYDHDHRRIRHSTLDELPALLSTSVLATLLLDLLLSFTPAGAFSSSSAIAVGLIAFAFCFLGRGMVRLIWDATTGIANGLVVGAGLPAEQLARRVATHPEANLRLVGYLGPEGDSAERVLPRLGSVADMSRIAREHAIERVVVTGSTLTWEEAQRLIAECKDEGMALTFLPRHYSLFGPGIELNRLAEFPVLDFRFSDPSRSTLFLKRVMDVVISAIFLALMLPLFLIVAVAILIDSGFPVFFRQRRAGKDGEAFRMVKFRTMVSDAEAQLSELIDLDGLEEPMFKLRKDPRVTRVGRFLRRTSIDELPQFWNVFRGSMSLVGPRPEQESIVAMYDERQRARLAVKPGLTGPMQVYGRGDLSFEERLSMERDYLDNISIGGDLAILIRTPRAVLRGDGAY